MEIEKYFQKAVAVGTEGIIAKKLDGPYQAGARDFNWIKYKKVMTSLLWLILWTWWLWVMTRVRVKDLSLVLGIFWQGVYDPATDKYYTVAKIGTGLTDEEWRRMKKGLSAPAKGGQAVLNKKPENYEVSKQMECDHWVEPKIVVEILADEITKSPMHTSRFALRFPPAGVLARKEANRYYLYERIGKNV